MLSEGTVRKAFSFVPGFKAPIALDIEGVKSLLSGGYFDGSTAEIQVFPSTGNAYFYRRVVI